MSWHNVDGLHEVSREVSDDVTEMELFDRHGDSVGYALISPQFIEPEAIVIDDHCFVRRDDGRYCKVQSVAGKGIFKQV